MKKQKESLEASLNQEDEENLDARIEDTVLQIASIEQEIRKLTDRSSELVSEIYTISLKLEEASFLQERYKTLRSQYNADLKRLRFIIEGDKSSKKKIKMIECPFCGSEMKRDDSNTQSYVEASETELATITEQLEDLKLVEKDVQAQITDLEGKIKLLNDENEGIVQQINIQLQPKAQKLV